MLAGQPVEVRVLSTAPSFRFVVPAASDGLAERSADLYAGEGAGLGAPLTRLVQISGREARRRTAETAVGQAVSPF